MNDSEKEIGRLYKIIEQQKKTLDLRQNEHELTVSLLRKAIDDSAKEVADLKEELKLLKKSSEKLENQLKRISSEKEELLNKYKEKWVENAFLKEELEKVRGSA